MVVHESPQYNVVDESPLPPPGPNTVGPVPPPPSPRHRQVAYTEQVEEIPHLIRPSSGGGLGEGHPSSGGGASTCCCAPHTPVLPCGGVLWSLRGRGGCWAGRWWVISSSCRGGSIVLTFWGPRSYRGEDKLQHTCGCPRCEVHYETCIQSLMAQVKDLRSQNLELQRSHQEPSQAVASTVGISPSYGDRMSQISSTLAKSDAAVQGYRRDSKVMEASVADHPKMSNGNTAKCFSAVESLATRYAAVASRSNAWDHSYSTPAEPVTVVLRPPSAPPTVSDPEPAVPTAPMGAPLGSSGSGCVLSFSFNPSHACIYLANACPDSGWPRGGEEHHGHPHPQEPTSWKGIHRKAERFCYS